ncbi:TipJ family phage tail tip protein [Bilophila wadsworthia]|uniref:TipJ family phage tail tip protein n=1 Tax=Bilophila wadsworthia TaxID=35833 RepID=UPI003A85DD70
MTEHVQRTEGRVCLTTAFDVCNPADVRVEWLPVAPGMGIGDLLERRDFVLDDGFDLAIVHNGRALDVPAADAIVLLPGDAVTARIIPAGGGGGSNPLQIVAMVALVALAISAPFMIGSIGGTALSTGGFFAGGTLTAAGSALAGGIMIGGSMLMSAAFPAPKPSLGQGLGQNALDQSATYGWQAQRNPTAQGGVIPIVQGTVTDITPFQLCSYISTDGDKQYFNGLYAVAEGTLDDIFDVKIDGNPASNYDNVRITKRLGTFAQTSIPEFSQVVQETAVGVKLSESWHTLTLSGTGLSKLGIGINAMQGLGYANDSGSLDPITVTVEVQYCLENSCEWKGLATLTLSDAKRSAVMKYEEFGVERVAEPYKLRARRASGPTGDRYISDVYWEYYHEVITDDFHLPGTALFAIWAMPTESLSGSIPKVTCSARRDTAMLPASDGSTVARPLSNPAYAVLELALNARYGAGELAANVDLQSFELAADWCDRKEIRGGMYIDAAMTFETAAGYWGQAGRFTLERVGVRLTCLSDRPQDFPDAAFLVTSADVQQGTFGMDWGNLEDRADGFEVTWFDDKRGKQTLFAPGPFFWKDKDRPPRVSPVTLYPCRDEDTAYRAANYLNRCNQYLTRTCSYTLGCKALGSHLHNGSVVQIAVDLLLNTQSGLVASATATTVTLNRDVHLEPGKAYEIALSHIDREDTRTGRELVEFVPLAPVDKATTTRTLTLAVPWRHVPSRDCSCAVGPLDRVVRWYRVTSMSRASDMTVKLSCLEYDEAIYTDEGGAPDTDGAGDWESVAGLMASIISTVEDGVEKRLLSLSWRGYAMRWKVFYRRPGVDSSWTLAGSTARPAYVVRNLEIGYVYRLAVTATSNPMDGKAIDVDFQLGSSSGVVLDVVVGSEPVMVGDQTVQAII